MVDDNGDPQTDERLSQLCTESFLRRPSVEPFAVKAICGFMNNMVVARHTPDHDYSYNAAVLFVFKDQASWWISGDASVMLFSDGKPLQVSEAKRYPYIGASLAYQPEAAPVIKLEHGRETALLITAGATLNAEDAERIGDLLRESDNPEAWMERIVQSEGERLSSALTAFIPPPKSGLAGFRK